MPTHTIKISGISEDLLKRMDEKVRKQRAFGRSQYVRDLIRKDVLGEEKRVSGHPRPCACAEPLNQGDG